MYLILSNEKNYIKKVSFDQLRIYVLRYFITIDYIVCTEANKRR